MSTISWHTAVKDQLSLDTVRGGPGGTLTCMASGNEENVEADRAPGALTQGLAAAAGAGVGALIGSGAGGSMVGAAMEPQLAILLQRAMQELGGLRGRSAARMVGGAAERLERSPDEWSPTPLENRSKLSSLVMRFRLPRAP